MKNSIQTIRNGVQWAVFVIFLLLFVPPIVVSWLPVWSTAQSLAMNDSNISIACGKPGKVTLSRWFYTYRFSGEFEHAVFRGSVQEGDCERRFRLRLDKAGTSWRITNIEFSTF